MHLFGGLISLKIAVIPCTHLSDLFISRGEDVCMLGPEHAVFVRMCFLFLFYCDMNPWNRYYPRFNPTIVDG